MNPKPCPFCGGEPEIIQAGTGRRSNIVSCTDCGCRLETSDTIDPWASWNRRELPAAGEEAAGERGREEGEGARSPSPERE